MNALKKNMGWKIASLVIGFLLWSYITAGVNPSQEVTYSNIPVQIDHVENINAQAYEVIDFKPETVSVKVSGKRKDLGRIDEKAIRASIDGDEIKEGSQTIPIHYEVPDLVMLSSSSDRYVNLNVEKIITASKPVHVDLKSELPDNLILEKVTPSPSLVRIKGPRSLVDKVAQLTTTGDLSKIKKDQAEKLEIVPVDKDGEEVEGVKLAISEVNVSFSILKQKKLPIRLVLEKGEMDESRIQLIPDQVLVEGKVDLIDSLSEIKTIPIKKKDLEKKSLEVSLDFPDGVGDVEDRETVRLEIFHDDKDKKKED